MIRKSISLKIFLVFLCFMLLILGIGWFMMEFYLENYYQHKKVETMENISIQIEKYLLGSSNKVQDYLDATSESIGGRILITDAYGRIRYMAGSMGFGQMGMGMGNMSRTSSILEEKDGASLYKSSNHMGTMEWLVYKRQTSTNEFIFVQIPFQSIKETVGIIQDFYLYIILIIIVFAVLIALIFSKLVTTPLVKLNHIVSNMKNLNHEILYQEDRDDEIGQLGKNFNLLVLRLKKTINSLQQELNKEKTLDKMRKNFVAQVSHEMQTPITVIQGYVEALQDNIFEDEDEDEREYYYSIIQDETSKMSRIVKDLLDLSQLEAGTFKISKSLFEFSSFVEDIYHKYAFICEEKGIELIKKCETKDVWINGDKTRLEQVIANLIQNGIKHTEKDNKISMELKQEHDNIIFSIFNQGKHIAQEDLLNVWNSFYKGDLDKDKKGTGLGLAITKNILELHESNYWIKNVEGGVEAGFILKQMSKGDTDL